MNPAKATLVPFEKFKLTDDQVKKVDTCLPLVYILTTMLDVRANSPSSANLHSLSLFYPLGSRCAYHSQSQMLCL